MWLRSRNYSWINQSDQNIFNCIQMLEWIFGSKKEEEKKEEELGKDEKWVYDYVRQYLTSPIWRNPLLDFIEDNSFLFQDAEENKFQYTKIFQEFIGLTALLLQSMIEEVGIPQKTLEKCIIKGIKSQRDARIFKQILLCDNFESFKKVMVTKNKELELQALKNISQESKPEQRKRHEKKIEIDAKELERLEIEKAIAMSLAVEVKAASQEEKELEDAIRLSQLEYKKEQQRRVQSLKKIEPEKEKGKEKEKAVLGELPPIVIASTKANRPIEQFKEEQNRLKFEIEQLKKRQQERRIKDKEGQQNAEDRKKRLLELRDQIRLKKKEERKEELSTFVQNKSTSESKVSEQEMERRRSLMKRIKEHLDE